MNGNDIRNQKNIKIQSKSLFNLSMFEVNVLILYFLSIFVAIMSEKNTKYIVGIVVISMIIFYIKKIFDTKEKRSGDFIGVTGFSIIAIPLFNFGLFLLIDKTLQTKELRIKENNKSGIEYIKELDRKDYKYKIYIDSTKEIKEINEIEFYSLKFNNCQSIKVVTEYYDIQSIFYSNELNNEEKQLTHLKDEILSEIISCNE